MPHVRVAHRTAPVRPPLVNQGANPRTPIPRVVTPRAPIPQQPQLAVRNRLPQYLPVLQPPVFPRETEFYEAEQYEQYQEEFYPYTTITVLDQQRATKQRLADRARLISSLQKFSIHPFLFLSNRYSELFVM